MAGGRYRLVWLVGVDEAVPAQLWRAFDIVRGQTVAITLIAGEHARIPESVVQTAARWQRLQHDGLVGGPRILEVLTPDAVLPVGVAAAVVSSWAGGRTLAQVMTPVDAGVRAAPPLGVGRVLRMLAPLAAEVQRAHDHGVALGCGHPARLVINDHPEKSLGEFGTGGGGVPGAYLGFAGPDPAVTMTDDVRGLGALGYLLLTGTWPLPATDTELASLPRAATSPRTADRPVPVAVIRPELPVEVTSLIDGALGIGEPRARLRTAAAVRRVIDQLLAERDSAVLPLPTDGGPAAPEEMWHTATFAKITTPATPRRKLSAGLLTLSAGLAVLVVYLVSQLASLCGITWTRPPAIVVNTITHTAPAHPAPAHPAPAHPAGPPSGGW